MRTPICERLGIEFPLFAFSHCRDVVAAVTNAGGFGVLGAVAYSPERLDTSSTGSTSRCAAGRTAWTCRARQASTAAAAGRGAPAPGLPHPRRHRDFVAHLLAKYGVSASAPFAGRPRQGAASGKAAGLTVGEGARARSRWTLKHPDVETDRRAPCGPPPPEHASAGATAGRACSVGGLVGTKSTPERQVAAGADLIVAQGTEAGGHTGEISTMVLVPQVVDAVGARVPVLAAGGIADGPPDGRGAWRWGAGRLVRVGLADHRGGRDPARRCSEKLLAATSLDTVRSRSRTGKPARQLRSAWTEEWDAATREPGPLPMPLQMLLAETAMPGSAGPPSAGGSGRQGAGQLLRRAGRGPARPGQAGPRGRLRDGERVRRRRGTASGDHAGPDAGPPGWGACGRPGVASSPARDDWPQAGRSRSPGQPGEAAARLRRACLKRRTRRTSRHPANANTASR